MNTNRMNKLLTAVRGAAQRGAEYSNDNWGKPCERTHQHNRCGTPLCVGGHYASRSDLQTAFYLDQEGRLTQKKNGRPATTNDLRAHFALTTQESYALFGKDGCGNVKTLDAAANWIEKFIQKKVKYALQEVVVPGSPGEVEEDEDGQT